MRFVQAARHGGSQTSVTRIVIHATVSPCVEGGARAVARYFQSAGAGGSAHYTVDPGEVVASVRESVVAYHAPPNTGSIGIELCDPQKGPASRWGDDSHQAMLRRAAVLVRQVAARWDVPLRRLTVEQVRAGKRGVCGHVDVSNAFGQTDHSDPGRGFPWDEFMHLVNDARPATPRPISNPTEVMVKKLPTLRVGDGRKPGDPLKWHVKTMHYLLLARDYAGLEGVDDTVFTEAHAEGIRGLQAAAGIEVDSVVGPDTWSVLLRVA